ncbi:MAG: VCBS repeat-containing protein [Deltaproteobacteria bacterium]|nr:VCBS repeat-containing protein [Deltaproteobacteria bacterium]
MDSHCVIDDDASSGGRACADGGIVDSGPSTQVDDWILSELSGVDDSNLRLLAVGDFDGDKHVDVIAESYRPDGGSARIAVQLYFGQGNGSFDSPQKIADFPSTDFVYAQPPAARDIDYDGKDDLFVSTGSEVEILPGSAISANTLARETLAVGGKDGYTVPHALPYDFNDDGKLDLLLDVDGSLFNDIYYVINTSTAGHLEFGDIGKVTIAEPIFPVPDGLQYQKVLAGIGGACGNRCEMPFFVCWFPGGEDYVTTGVLMIKKDSGSSFSAYYFSTVVVFRFDLIPFTNGLAGMIGNRGNWTGEFTKLGVLDFSHIDLTAPQKQLEQVPLRSMISLPGRYWESVSVPGGVFSGDNPAEIAFLLAGSAPFPTKLVVLNPDGEMLYEIDSGDDKRKYLPADIGNAHIVDIDEDGWNDMVFTDNDHGTVRILLNRLREAGEPLK